MPVTNLTNPDMEVGIPGVYQDYSKITITADDDTIYTVMDTYGGDIDDNYISDAIITREATGKLATFRFTLANNDGTFLNKFDGGETVVFYADDTDATTEIFRGTIDEVMYGFSKSSGFFIEIDGRQYPELMDKTITGVEGASTADVSLAFILHTWYSDIGLKYWNGTSWITATYDSGTNTVSWSGTATDFPTTLINLTYEHRKGWNVMTGICVTAGLECYLTYESGWVLKIFNTQSITNANCNIMYGINLIDMGDYGTANSDVYNRIYVYGATTGDNVISFKSKSDTSSQSNLWIKDKIVSDGSVDTLDELDDAATFELTKNTNLGNSGRFSAVGLKTLNPGEKVMISVPYCGVNGSFVVKKITHTFNQYVKTTVEVSKTLSNVIDLFVPQVNYEGFLSGFNNPNAMEGSYSASFENNYDHVYLVGCYRATDGSVKLLSTETTGTITFDTYTTDALVSKCEVRKYDNYNTGDDVYEVSNDSGVTWETYDMGVTIIHNFLALGSGLRLRVTLNRDSVNDASPVYKALGILYK